MHFITGKQMERRTFLRGAMGAAVALPFLDAMVSAKGVGKASAAAADRTRLICIEEVHGLAGCNKMRRGQVPLRARADRIELHDRSGQRAVVTRAVSPAHDDRLEHRRAHGRGVHRAGNRRRPLPLERGVPDAVASETDAGLGHLGRHVVRPDVCAALRPGHADAVDAVLHREPRPGRRLHLQLLLRLHRLDQLGVAERAAADDSRPARRVRHAVRHRRLAVGSRRPPQVAPQHPRLRLDGSGRRQQGARRQRQGPPRPLPDARA